jgi:predicted nucleic acid-binding protein
MRTAVDTSVLVAIFNAEPTGEDWLKKLIAARREGQLVIGEVVYAELARGFESPAELDQILERLGIWFESITKEGAFRAGKAFSQYRKRGGPRTNLIPDFLVAGHALEQANRLATEDRGYYREYFSGLTLVGRQA